jgi:integrase
VVAHQLGVVRVALLLWRDAGPARGVRSPHQRKEPKKLPVVLSGEEIVRFLQAVPGLRNRAALTTAYGAGLRESEVAALTFDNLDSNRMVIRVEHAFAQALAATYGAFGPGEALARKPITGIAFWYECSVRAAVIAAPTRSI